VVKEQKEGGDKEWATSHRGMIEDCYWELNDAGVACGCTCDGTCGGKKLDSGGMWRPEANSQDPANKIRIFDVVYQYMMLFEFHYKI
jgi:hypothetical protein